MAAGMYLEHYLDSKRRGGGEGEKRQEKEEGEEGEDEEEDEEEEEGQGTGPARVLAEPEAHGPAASPAAGGSRPGLCP